MNLSAEFLAECAARVEEADPIDWGMLSIKEADAFLLMSHHVIELLKEIPPDSRGLVLAASLVKLLVETFVLQVQLAQSLEGDAREQLELIREVVSDIVENPKGSLWNYGTTPSKIEEAKLQGRKEAAEDILALFPRKNKDG
jgi:hypothetical protein